MSASTVGHTVLFPGTKKTKANAGTTDAAVIFNYFAWEGLEASSSILSVCCFLVCYKPHEILLGLEQQTTAPLVRMGIPSYFLFLLGHMLGVFF